MPVPAQSRAYPRVLAVFLFLLGVLAPAVAGAAPASAWSLIPGEDVTTAAGTVRGNVDLDHREFDGIPFAAPPTGPLRWQPPQPVTPWSGERAATSKGPSCPQAVPKVGIALPGSSEDCLTLDVETPPVARSKQLPVMVWFYGGAYALGATSQYDPTPLVTQGGVIVVSVNYRVGPLGFVLQSQLQGAVSGPLPFLQSVALVWPQMTGLLAGFILLFTVGYVLFQRQEVRA